MGKKTASMRLNPAFLDSFDWKRHHVTRPSFCDWGRNVRVPPIRIDQHKWRPLREGEPVPEELVLWFSEYISDGLHLGRYPASEIASYCEREPEPSPTQERKRSAWTLGWAGLFAEVTRNFSLPEEAYCQHAEDIHRAATMIMECVGVYVGKTAPGSPAIAWAESHMKRSLDEYALWLLMLWKANENTVLFATQRIDGRLQRIGSAVVVPLSRAFYQRLRDGKAEDADCGPDDLASQSKYLLIEAVAENLELDVRRAKASRSMAQAMTHLYQLAALCSPLHIGSTNPYMISFGATPENIKRLRAYNYVEVGTKTRLTGMEVMEFAPPKLKVLGRSYALALGQYLAMKAMLLFYQAHISGDQLLLGD